ncbi:hypothetical protein [Heliorestis convoluta]|uniref:Type II secretion system F family protein n=1 Tax=Heliorestis convoluta TaxID=356322 RepID=A0A5Q2N1D2_9FIRM|nr:hypothetical protein [Heliorestis convoluta]QGG46355.1 hypothetical protein FTV88_0176 [Heliorestis convoluta]
MKELLQPLSVGMFSISMGYLAYMLAERNPLKQRTNKKRKVGYRKRLEFKLQQSGVSWSVKDFLVYQLGAAFLSILSFFILEGLLGIAVAALGTMFPFIYLQGERKKRVAEIRPHIPTMLRRVQRGVEQGLGWREILLSLPDSVPEGALRDELTMLASTYIATPVLKDRLEEFARRINMSEIDSFALTLGQSESTGRVVLMLQKLEELINREMEHEETRKMKKKAEVAPVFPTIMVLNIVILIGMPLLLAFMGVGTVFSGDVMP